MASTAILLIIMMLIPELFRLLLRSRREDGFLYISKSSDA